MNNSNIILREEVESLNAALKDMKSKYEGEGTSSAGPSLDPKQLKLENDLLKEKLKGMFAIFLYSQLYFCNQFLNHSANSFSVEFDFQSS